MDQELLERKRARHRERMATEPAYREAQRQKALRAYRKKDRDRVNANWKAAEERRRAADPTYAAERLEKQNDRRRERLAVDSEYRERSRMDRRLAQANLRFGSQPCSRYFSQKIRAFYVKCPPQYEVDHIEPMFTVKDGVVVACGLHVPWNLQYVTRSENARKGNANPAAGAAAWRKPYAGRSRRK